MSAGIAVNVLKGKVKKLEAEKAELLAAILAWKEADKHWFDDGPTGCQECDRDEGAPCEVQQELEQTARKLRAIALEEKDDEDGS